MKNAVIRIIAWSTVALALIGVLIWAIVPQRTAQESEKVLENYEAGFGTSTPQQAAEIPVNGVDNNETEDTRQSRNTQPYGEETSVADVTTLEIDWISGAVRIESYDGAEVRFSDNYNGEDTYQTVWSFADGVLEISYCKDSLFALKLPEKRLLVRVPAALLEKLEVDTVSASLELDGVKANTMDIESVSGSLSLTGSSARAADLTSVSGKITGKSLSLQKLDVETTSGEIALDGDFADAEIQTLSGKVDMTFARRPDALEAESTSGEMTFCFPVDSTFSYWLDSVSGKAKSTLDGASIRENDADFTFFTMSGNVNLNPAK